MIFRFPNKPLQINLLLFLCSFGIYSFYFHEVFLHLNSVLCSNTGDSLKNYYTFAFQATYGNDLLNFEGLNYPYGEHVVYTDCQPILVFILHSLPFSHNYLIGILHGLIFFSFIITPLILNQIFLKLKLPASSSFFLALAITLLSPQYFKILAGHFALAYACIIPLNLLLLIRLFDLRSKKQLLWLFVFNLSIFFLHPYFGLGTSLFSFLGLFIYDVINFNKKVFLRQSFSTILTCLIPVILFKLFMLLTDHHENRTLEPENINLLKAKTGSLVLPNFGPFREFLAKVFPVENSNFEGFSYLGIFLITLTLLFPVLLLIFRKRCFSAQLIACLLAATFLLFMAFGWHNDLLALLGIRIPALDQFRACGRFIWFFYYTLPVVLFAALFRLLEKAATSPRLHLYFGLISFTYFAFNFTEANALYRADREAYWKCDNIFNPDLLSAEQKENTTYIKKQRLQAIIPLPLYHSGSEMFVRYEQGSMLPSFLYSYHCRLPVLSSFLSRTSITETKEVIQTLNAYKKEHAIRHLFNSKSFLVVQGQDGLMPDEERFRKKVIFYTHDGKTNIGMISLEQLFERRERLNCELKSEGTIPCDSEQVIFVHHQDRRPFTSSNLKEYERIYAFGSNLMNTGNYVVSFHFHYTGMTHRSVACNFIVMENGGWISNDPIKNFSGFYDGFAVYERKVYIDKTKQYDFILKGLDDQEYHISDFMFRPEQVNVFMTQGRDSIFNNFPD